MWATNRYVGHRTLPMGYMLFSDTYRSFLEIILTSSSPWEIGFYPKMGRESLFSDITGESVTVNRSIYSLKPNHTEVRSSADH